MEVAVQVSPRNDDEDCLSTPTHGIIPKQENITGNDVTMTMMMTNVTNMAADVKNLSDKPGVWV